MPYALIGEHPMYAYGSGWELYYEDSLVLLKSMLDASIDLVCTDPPYGMAWVSNHRQPGDTFAKPIIGDESLGALERVLPDLFRVLKPDAHAYFFAHPLHAGEVKVLLERAGFDVKSHIAWDKGDGGTAGDLEVGYSAAWESILYCTKGRGHPLNPPRPRNVIRIDWSGRSDPETHPTVKPVELLERLILSSSQPGDLVLDPFAGSCTTLRAAANQQRRAMGIEIVEEYCKVGVERMRQLVLGI